MQYFIPRIRGRTARRLAFVQSLLLLELGGLAGGLLVYFMARPLSYVFCGDYSLVAVLKVYWPVVPFLGFWVRASSIFNSIERPKLAAAMVGFYGLVLVASVGGATIYTRELGNLFASQAAALGVFMVVGAVLGWVAIKERTDVGELEEIEVPAPAAERLRVWRQLAYAFPLVLTFLVAAISRLIDKTLVSHRFSSAEFAVYANGAIEVPIGVMLVTAVYSVIFPRFTRQHGQGNIEEAVRLNHLAVKNIAMIVFPSAVFLAMFSTDLMVVLFGERFAFSGRVFMLYSIAMLTVIYSPYSVINATGKTRLTFGLTVIAVCINFLFSWVGITLFGMIGPAIGSVTYRFVVHLLFARVAAGAVGVTFGRILPWRALGAMVLAALAAGIPACLVLLIPIYPLVRVAAGACVYGLAYLLIARKARIIQDAHLEIIRGLLAGRRSK